MAAKLKISRLLWFQIGSELRRRGRGRSESGAFLLTKVNGFKVERAVYYDDLDPHYLDNGYIELDGAAFVPLWDLCAARGLRVAADIHTHPTRWTNQSQTDIRNPMVPIKGHLSLIAPEYAKSLFINLNGIGIFEYQAYHKWKSWGFDSGVIRLMFP